MPVAPLWTEVGPQEDLPGAPGSIPEDLCHRGPVERGCCGRGCPGGARSRSRYASHDIPIKGILWDV